MHRSTERAEGGAAPGSLFLSAVAGAALATGGFAIGVGASGAAAGSTSFWYLSRASGFVAYLLLWGSVVWGLLLSTGTGRAWASPPKLLGAHEYLSSLSVGFACFHGLILMGDRYVAFSLQAVVIPFAGRHEPLLVACGQVALWLSLLLIASFHLRRSIGGQMWRRLHYASFVAFWLAFVHGVLVGSETATVWATVQYLGTSATVLFLVMHRVLSTPRLQTVLAGS
ncbi:MAG: hypothetical protein ABL982_08480 [Vicinamibacterales bacterium]